jgi:hypothetical protein
MDSFNRDFCLFLSKERLPPRCLNAKTVLWFSRFPRRKQEHLAGKIQGFGLVGLFLLCRPNLVDIIPRS